MRITIKIHEKKNIPYLFAYKADPGYKVCQFLSSEQRCDPKSLNVALNIAGVERIRSENPRLRSTLDTT